VHQARADARAEAEAAAEQRLAALDQARREEREAAVREALALGVRRVSAHPETRRRGSRFTVDSAAGRHALLWLFMSTLATSSAPVCRAAAERARRGSWHGLRRGGACRTLLTRAQPAKTMVDLWFCPVTAEDIASRQGADMFLLCRNAALLPVPAPGHGCRVQGAGHAAAR
jgi:hypothetical protein